MKTIGILLLAGLTLGLAACKSEKKPQVEDIIAPTYEAPKLSPPIRLQESMTTNEFKLGGETVKYTIVRSANDSLPMVQDNIGQEFVDNTISLAVTKAGGESIFKRTFTKGDFNAHLTDEFRRSAILDGIAFDRVEKDTAFFGISVAIPQTDEYIPLMLALTKDGKTSLSLDTTPEADFDE